MTPARATLRRLAVPRLCGTPGASLVEGDVRATLEALGYPVEAQRFTFSAWPVSHGVRFIGLLCGAAMTLAAALIASGHAGIALGLLLALAVTSLVFVAIAGHLITHLPWRKAAGTNLWAMPSGGSARFLVIAHRDSKSQTIPLGLRIAAAIALLAAFALLLGHAAHVIGLGRGMVAALGVVGLTAGVVLGFCGVGNDSTGALDNASGLATLLHIAERERASGDVGFLVTDGEEFGLAGSRAALAQQDSLAGIEAAINFDGVDDEGGFFILEGRLPRHRPSVLSSIVEAAAHARGSRVRRRPVPPGLMVDHVPFLRSGIPALTLMHGGLLSLARVHRPSDNLERMAGTGIGPTVDVACEALRLLRGRAAAADSGLRVARAGPSV